MTSEGGGGGLSLTVSSDSISGTNIILLGGGHQEEQEGGQKRHIQVQKFIIFVGQFEIFLTRSGTNKQKDRDFSKN